MTHQRARLTRWCTPADLLPVDADPIANIRLLEDPNGNVRIARTDGRNAGIRL